MTQPPVRRFRKDDMQLAPAPPPELLLTLDGQGLEIWRTHLENVAEQQRNAQVVPPEAMERLAETIRRDGRMESLPFVARREGPGGQVRFEMISGHHRLRAARAAGLDTIVVLADATDLGRSQVVAKQLAHNQIVGAPDPQVVAQMFAEVQTLEDALEAYVDPDLLSRFVDETTPLAELEEPAPEWHSVQVAFLPLQFHDFERLLDRLTGEEKMLCLADMAGFADFQALVMRVKKLDDIRNVSGQFVRMCELANERLDQIEREAAEHGQG
jgi:hypothetical protein